MTEQALFLSADRKNVLDGSGRVVYVASRKPDGKTIYVDAAPSAEGRVCVRTETKAKKICVEYNKQKVCAAWDLIEIEICVEWSN